ncbi:MAG: response regulator [Gemmatimonadetes bacterium]|jgi:DNA-binding NtrC family response regulator|nr:response regulator [Gemmatimonadota bacterium]
MACDRVLLVDDEESFVTALGKRLNARELKVETSNSGEEAIAKAKQQEFDVVVLDLAMPGMDGIETLKRLLQIDPDLQIILLTGHGSIEKAVEATKLGAMDFLQKPASLPDLLELIRQASKKRAVLMDKRISQQMADVINKKGW